MTTSFMKIIKIYKLYFLAIIFFIFYLITLPYINELTIPCLKPIPQTSYTDKECNFNLTMDKFTIMSLTGFVVFGAIIFIFGKRKAYLPFIFTMIVLASLTVGVYLNYIKLAEKQVRNAPIILEQINK